MRATTLEADQEEALQAPEGDPGLHPLEVPSGVDGPRGAPGHPAGPAPARPARGRPLRDLRPQRPLPPRHQPQQPAAEPDAAEDARRHHPQRKADAAGGRRRPLRQRPPRPPRHGRRQPPAQVALRHAQGQAGPLPPEPPRQARRLLRPLRHRHRPRAEAAPVRPPEEDGARPLRAVHHPPPQGARLRAHRARRPQDDREEVAGGLGHPRGGDQGPPGAAQPRADPAPPLHPGVRARPHRGRGHPHPSARLHRLQRRLRRRPDGRPRAAVARGDHGVQAPDDGDLEHLLALLGQADPHALAGHRPRRLLPHDRAAQEGRPRTSACRCSAGLQEVLFAKADGALQDARLGRRPEPRLRPRHGLRQQGARRSSAPPSAA